MQMDTTNPYGATSPEAIAEFEARWGVLLPFEYQQFLLKSNGGMPIPENFRVPDFHGQGSALTSFYGIHNGPEHNRLDQACDVHRERIPADLIPIAWDAFGNEVCIGWKGERQGKIYFWDHEDELDENGLFVQDYRNVFWVANSLQEFLDSLMTLEDFEIRHPAKRT
jgi:hypothetical protein